MTEEVKDFRHPLIGMTLEGLERVAEENGLPRYSARQMASWLYSRRATSIEAMTDIPKTGRSRLEEKYDVGYNLPVSCSESSDGTKKYLFTVNDGALIESVYIPDKDRATLCVSSQIGCRMNCSFCATGRNGFHGNLSTHDIINQILAIPESTSLTNVVFMGMGEPLDNLTPVLKSIEILTSKWGLGWSPKRITVSTVGKGDNLKRLIEETKVHIALSVHFPFSEEREAMMPVERAYPVGKIIEELARYDFSKQRRCSIEYIMWKGVNDDPRHASALAKLLRPIKGVRVNLIRYHSIDGKRDLVPADQKTMESFRDYLNDKGITATIRGSRGEDIMAACGMLAGQKNQNFNQQK